MTEQEKSPWPDEWPSPEQEKSTGWPKFWPNPTHYKRQWFWLSAGSMLLILLTVSIWQTFLPGDNQPSEACHTLYDPTSSWYSAIFVNHDLPPTRPGDSLPMTVSGGYGIQGTLLTMCGYEFTRESNHAGLQLGDPRFITAHLDGQFLLKAACDEPCLITVTIPQGTAAGTHQLTLRSFDLNDAELAHQTFDLQVLD